MRRLIVEIEDEFKKLLEFLSSFNVFFQIMFERIKIVSTLNPLNASVALI